MKIENQVCSLEYAKHFKRILGLKQDCLFTHVDNTAIGYEGIKLTAQTEAVKRTKKLYDGGVVRFYNAFTALELIELLPEGDYESGWSQTQIYPVARTSMSYVNRERFVVTAKNWRTKDEMYVTGKTLPDTLAEFLLKYVLSDVEIES